MGDKKNKLKRETITNETKYPFLSEFSLSKIDNKKNISFVMGVPCSGKTDFIKKFFPKNTSVIDIYDIQKELDSFSSHILSTIKSYEIFKHKMIIDLLCEKEIVLECTFYKRKRRIQFVSEIKEISNQMINLYILYPSKEQYNLNCKSRNLIVDIHAWDEIEIPLEECFNNIYYVDEEGIYTPKQFLSKLKGCKKQLYYRDEELITILEID